MGMEIKTYRANSMQEAIALVRRELGPDAAILHTRPAPGGILGWLSGRQIEVTASADVPIPSRFERQPRKSARPPADRAAAPPPDAPRPAWAGDGQQRVIVSRSSAMPARADAVDHREAYRQALKSQEEQAPSIIEKLSGDRRSRFQSWPPALQEAYRALLAGGFPHAGACELIASAGDEPHARHGSVHAIMTRVQQQLAAMLCVQGPLGAERGRQHTVALVGPTGVGKTTTIAKLAAHFRLKEKLNVGLITVDTYRIAAVEQLRTYAEIIDLPMEIVATPRDMRRAMSQLAAADLILIDTAGRSPHDQNQLQELKSTLAEAHPHETHLVLSTVAGEASLNLAARQFSQVGVTALLLTKLDESIGLGALYSLLERRLPLSYFTHGQGVPHDIRPAHSAVLAQAMVTGYMGSSEGRQ